MLSVRETTEAGHAGPTRPTTLGQGRRALVWGRGRSRAREPVSLSLSFSIYILSLSFLPLGGGRRRRSAASLVHGSVPCDWRRRESGGSLLFPRQQRCPLRLRAGMGRGTRLSGRRCCGQSRRRIIIKRNLASPSSAPRPGSPATSGDGGAGAQDGGRRARGQTEENLFHGRTRTKKVLWRALLWARPDTCGGLSCVSLFMS